MQRRVLKATIGKDGGRLRTPLGTRRVEKEAGRTYTKETAVLLRLEDGDQECNNATKRGFGMEADIDRGSMEVGPLWGALREKTS